MVGTAQTLEAADPVRTCVVASTPWSGSRLVCQVLGRTGAMGTPAAWFDPLGVPRRGRELGLSVEGPHWPASFLGAVRVRATAAETCGLLLMWTHLRWLLQAARTAQRDVRSDRGHQLDSVVLGAWFPHPAYVWLRSHDAHLQALRWYLDRHGEAADLPGGVPPSGAVDYQEVRWLEEILRDHDRGWGTYFAIHDIRPVTVYYEDLPQWTVASVTSLLGELGVPAVGQPPEPGVVAGPIDAAAGLHADGYRRVRHGLSATVGVRATHW